MSEAIPDEGTTVWRVRLGRDAPQQDAKGLLSLREEGLTFLAENGARYQIDFAQVRKVKRVLGSPVLMVHHQDGDELAETAFYFTKPPPLTLPNRRGVDSKRKARKAGVHYLGRANPGRKEEIKGWVERIRAETPRMGENT
ncbi:MAG: hypothetical protein WEA10_06245 [Actinomycetota bacterium]